MNGPSARILVVDDEKLIRWSVSERLQRGGYEVITAEAGEQALGSLGGGPPGRGGRGGPGHHLLCPRLERIDGLLPQAELLRRELAQAVP